jgi:hypothetical protein
MTSVIAIIGVPEMSVKQHELARLKVESAAIQRWEQNQFLLILAMYTDEVPDSVTLSHRQSARTPPEYCVHLSGNPAETAVRFLFRPQGG